MQKHISNVHVHMPYSLLPKYLKIILQNKLNLEIYFHHQILNRLDKSRCMETAKILESEGLKITFHAPFVDLRPGALDETIRRASIDRIRQVFDLAPYFHPLKIVCHASFDDRYYVYGDDLWLESSLKTWKEFIGLADDHRTIIALENVYEKNPVILGRLFRSLASDRICFCFDTGHFNVFSCEPLNVWFDELGRYTGHLHLHDNFGWQDEHLSVGHGTFPFAELMQYIRNMKKKPTVTLEAHNQKNLWASLDHVKRMDFPGV